MGKWIKCKRCSHEYDSSIKRCPECYEKAPIDIKTVVGVVAAAVVALVVIIGLVLGFTDKEDGGKESSGTPTSSTASVSSVNASSTESSSSEEKVSSSSKKDTAAETSSEKNGGNTSTVTYRKPTDSDGNIKVGDDGIVHITIPEWLLLLVEPDFDYTLTDKEKNELNFLGVTKNSDGSATYDIGYNDSFKNHLMLATNTHGMISGLEKLDSVTEVEFTYYDIKTVKIFTTHTSAEDISGDTQLTAGVLNAGLYTTVYQYYHLDYNVGSVFEIYGSDNTLLATSTYPDVLRK